ncbi:MAG: 5-(carboxyamino)imidazole ribonucleotide mutase [Candidatus Bathyarchaeia archaeon]
MPDVLVIIGSMSDKEHARKVVETLNAFGIKTRVEIASAHRAPDKVKALVEIAEKEGVCVFIAIAGLSALLPSLIAAYTIKPVIGVPVKRALEGLDSLLSIVQTPQGVPVACVGIDNAVNAALLAAEIVCLQKTEMAEKLLQYRNSLRRNIEQSSEELRKLLG